MLGRRGQRGWVVALAAVAIASAAGPAWAVDQAQVGLAIDRGREGLFQLQKNGNWETVPAPDPTVTSPSAVENGQWGGLTALATLALLASGADPNDPRIKQAVAFLEAADIQGNYALGLRAQVWNLLPQDALIKQAALRDCTLLKRGIHLAKGDSLGFYGYLVSSEPDDYDHSVSQFGVLGMWSLAQQGVEVPTAYWQTVDAAWRRQEAPDGSWWYKGGTFVPGVTYAPEAPSVAMTAAGVATLLVAQEYTQMAPRCNGNLEDPAIDAGLKYLGQHVAAFGGSRPFYAMFGVSRVGLAGGYKYLGPTDWFQWGATQALSLQNQKDGSWSSETNIVPDTAFALLFLSRGRLPIMLNKLQYEVAGLGAKAKPVPGLWNQRPRDAANLSRWVGRQLESPLNWQLVNLGQSATDLHDAPILYMAGGKAPKLSNEDAAKLRTYLEDGGLLVGHADCGASDFSAGFRALGERMFPGRKFRMLEPTSPIYTKQTFARTRWITKPPVDALTNGDRELMVLLPQGDPARQWQAQSFQPVKNDTFGQLMIDLLLYAVDTGGLRKRGDTYIVARDPAVPAVDASVGVARIKYAGNWDPEPGGWRRLANVLHNDRVAELNVQAVDPAAGDKLDPKATPLASLTFADADGHLSDGARSALRDYVKAGGTLLVDVAGGRGLYGAAATSELAKIFPDAPHDLPVLPPDSKVFTGVGPRLAVASVDYRRFNRVSGSLHRPQLRGYTMDGRVAVLYSPEDLSVGLVGQAIDGVAGYVPADATKVVSAVVAYAAKLAPN
jgi:hypothetical protein